MGGQFQDTNGYVPKTIIHSAALFVYEVHSSEAIALVLLLAHMLFS